MELLLVDPPKPGWWLLRDTVMPNLGLAYLASYVRRELGDDVDVEVLDCAASGLSWRDLESKLSSGSADVVGVSAITCTFSAARRVCEMAKEADPRVVTVVGGPHPTFLPGEVLRGCPSVDVVVRGEGEATLAELLRKLMAYGSIGPLRGISYREGGRVVHCPPRELIGPLDKVPPPAWDLLPMDRYRMSAWGSRVMVYVSSRGCPFRCSFCSEWVFWRGVWRAHSAERVVNDLTTLSEGYGKDVIWFCDDTFNVDRSRIARLCRLIIERDLNVKWGVEARVDLLFRDLDMLDLMVEAGLFWVLVGIESQSKGDLALIRKGITREQVERVVKALRDRDVIVQGMFIVGLPDDDEEAILERARYAARLGLDFAIFTPLTPLPGTALFYRARREGALRILDYDKYDFAHAVLDTKHLSYGEVQRLVLRCYREFYSSAPRVLRGLLSRNEFRRRVYWHFIKLFLGMV